MKKEDPDISVPDVYRMSHSPNGLWVFRNAEDTADSSATIEVKVSAERPEALKRMLHELAVHGCFLWR